METKIGKHKLWARIGITCYVDKEMYERLKKRNEHETSLTKEEADYFRKNGFTDGDSYIPDIEYKQDYDPIEDEYNKELYK